MKIYLVWLLLFLVNKPTITEAQSVPCAAGAERNADGECVCLEGLHGHGELCCNPLDHKVCRLENDPILVTMNGDLLPIDLPCPTLVAEVHTMGENYDETVHAYVAGEYTRNGVLQLNDFILEYREQFRDIHTLVEIYNDQLTIDGEIIDKSQNWSSSHHEVNIGFNPETQIFSLYSMGTTIIHIKPPNKDTEDQKTIPGICVGIARQSLLYDVGMCNQRRRALTRSTINKGFTHLQAGVVEHILRTLPPNKTIGSEEVQSTCMAINQEHARCGDQWNPAIKACFILVSNPTIRYCLVTQGLKPLEVFSQCTEAHCGFKQQSCAFIMSDSVKKCINITPDCSGLYP